jgi:NAD(P)-dependent dehydrogenase (short-subunit alcohol dehydrogenase family)
MSAYNLNGRTAIITGASQGLGFEIALAFLKAGASVCVCARDPEGLEAAASRLKLHADRGQMVIVEAGDVSSEPDVSRIVSAATEAFAGRIDILVNNAGIYGPKGPVEELSWHEWVRTIEINLFGSVLMARAVVPFMKQTRYGKIIQLSGGGATQPMARFTAYAASKAAVVRFIDSLAEEVRGDGIDVNSIAAGALNTRFLDEVLAAGPEKVGAAFYKRSLEQKEKGGAPFERPAALCLFLASQASDGISGKLISALWDNWESFADHREELAGSDIYTIRRIVGRDRGHEWGDK